MAVPSLLPVKPEGNEYYHPDKWTARHRLVVSLHLAGFKNKEIAEALNLTPSRVSIILGDVRARVEVQRMSKQISDRIVDVHARLHIISNDALSVIEEQMRTSENENIRQKAAFGILDRAGYTPGTVEKKVGTTISPEIAGRIEAALSETEDDEDYHYEEIQRLEAKFDDDLLDVPIRPGGGENELVSVEDLGETSPEALDRDGFSFLRNYSSDDALPLESNSDPSTAEEEGVE